MSNNNNKNNGALGKALFGLGALAISAGVAYLKGKAESDKNEVVRREQTDKQEKKQHEAIVKTSQGLQNTLPYEKRLILEPYNGLNIEQIREKYNAYKYKLTELYSDADDLDMMDLAMEAEDDNFESNDLELLNALGVYYDEKAKDAVKAFNCFKKAAYLSLAEACFNLGKWYLDGGDCVMAQEWFEKLSCSSNSPISELEETNEDEWDNLFDEIEEEITDTINCNAISLSQNLVSEFYADRDCGKMTEHIVSEIKVAVKKLKLENKFPVSVRAVTDILGVLGNDNPCTATSIEELINCISEIYKSWDSPRANVYRRDNDISFYSGFAIEISCPETLQLTKNKESNSYIVVNNEVTETLNVKTEDEISEKELNEAISLSEQENPIADNVIISEAEITSPIAECGTVEITESANSNSVISLNDVIKKIKNANFSDCTAYSCYIIGDLKFETKLRGAKSKYAFFNNTEKALCLLDYTLFGSAKEGFVITTENFYANFIGESIRISISDICGVKVKAKDTVNIEYIYGDNIRKYEVSGLDNGKSAKFAENFYDTVSFIKDYNT